VDLLNAGERVKQETRHWDESAGRTRAGRSKEEAEDYRYFPEPDLVPLDPDSEWLARMAASLPPLPADRRAALGAAAGVDASGGGVALAVQRDLDELALAAIAAGGDAARVLTHVEHNLAVDGAESLDPNAFAALTKMEVSGTLTATQAKAVLAEMVTDGGDPAAIAAAKGYEAMDTGALEAVVDETIAANPAIWDKLVGGDKKAMGALVGQVMKATQGKADGKTVNTIIQQRLAAAG
jgi:aspartyl-tRNA(Asn)/glutamyl-tRNA(Gln) amidotransferase subunit B